MNSKLVLTATAVLIGIFGLGWLIAPDGMGNYWRIDPGDNLICLYGALALNAWPAVVVEFVLVMGFVWVLFIKPEPVL